MSAPDVVIDVSLAKVFQLFNNKTISINTTK